MERKGGNASGRKKRSKRMRMREVWWWSAGERGKKSKNLFWNVAGLENKCEETWEYLESFDKLGLTETWMREHGTE